jgi:predicted MFS family arabinose efflux permease
MDLGMMATSLAVALLLAGDPPIGRFRLFFVAGILLGMAGSIFLFRIPEPPSMSASSPSPLFVSVREIAGEPALRRFFSALLLLTASLGIIYPFLIIHAKRVYLFTDNQTILLTIAGGAGSIAGSLLCRRFTDRYGSKPLMLFFVVQMLLVAFAVAVVPAGPAAAFVPLLWIYLLLLFFTGTMGYFAIQHVSQVYLFGLLSSRQQLNIGILYFLAQGIAGLAGGTLGGMLADLLEAGLGLPVTMSHRIIFACAGLLSAAGLLLVRGWKEPRAWSFTGALHDVAGEMLVRGFWWGRAPR